MNLLNIKYKFSIIFVYISEFLPFFGKFLNFYRVFGKFLQNR